jgi:hypothetical protein
MRPDGVLAMIDMLRLISQLMPGMVFSLVISLPASAASSVTFDGEWWQGLSSADKTTAVQGMLAGYSSGYSKGVADSGTTLLVHVALVESHMTSGLYNIIVTQHPPSMNATAGVIIDRLDNLYAEHPEIVKDATAYYIACAASDSGTCEAAIKAIHK